MDYTQWRGLFFNTDVIGPNSNRVFGQVHRGHPNGVPRIQQMLRPRGAQPHEIGFINSYSDVNARFEAGVENGQFVVNTPGGPATPPVRSPLALPIAGTNAYATPSAYRVGTGNLGLPNKPRVGGGTGGLH